MNDITKFRGNQTERFTTITDGVVPAPESSTGKFLRDDGTWAEMSGSITPTGSNVVWGDISGTLSNQTDLQNALDNKLNKNLPITGSTKVKITYDTNGLITSGSDATTADINEVTDKRYVTDAQIVILGNTSGVNSGDETTASIKSKLNSASLSSDGYLTSGSFSVFNSKQDSLGYTPANIAGDTFTGNISASNLSGTNTGDETTASIQTKRPLKTINSQSLEGSGDISIITNPSGNISTLQYNNSGTFSGSANAIIQNDELAFPDVQNPTTPTSAVKLYGKKLLERFLLAFKDPNGFENFIQPSLISENIQLYKAAGSVNQLTILGGVTMTATGTLTGSVISTTNIYTQSRIVEWLQTSAGSTNVAGFRNNNAFLFRGASSSQGGFFFIGRWGPATGVATATNRASFGLHANQSAPTDVEPSTIINQLTMGWDAADTNIQIMSNQGTGTATKKDLGASFPVPTTDRSKVYELGLYCPPGGTTVYYYVRDIGTGAVTTGTIVEGVDSIPANTVLLGPKGWISVGGTSSVIGIGLHSIYIGTNY